MPSPLEVSTHTHPLISMLCSSYTTKFSSSLAEWSPLLSGTCSQRGGTSNLDRSSYGSSLRSWDTASTLVSFCDLHPVDLAETHFNVDADQLIDPARLTRNAPRLKSKFPSAKTIPEEDLSSSEPTPNSAGKPTWTRRGWSKNHRISESDVPMKATRAPGKYSCTSCQRGFSRKGD
jgi:hypothetical protein